MPVLTGSVVDFSDIFPLYRMSYMWYTFFGTAVAIGVAHLCALVFGFNDPADIDAALVAPFLRGRCGDGRCERGGRSLPPHILGDDSCGVAGDIKSRVFLSRVVPLHDDSAL